MNLPWFTTGLGEVFRGSLEVMQDFIHTWTSEEDQHANVLETYLLVTRNTDPNRLHRLRKTVVRNGWTPGEASAFEGMAYTSIQELSTQAFYIRVAEAAEKEDPQLALILRTLAKDETLHYVFYRDAVKIHLEINPNYIWPLADVMVNFAMPGYLMPHFKERTYIIAEHTNYGIAEFYRQVIKVLADYWDLRNLPSDVPRSAAGAGQAEQVPGLAGPHGRDRRQGPRQGPQEHPDPGQRAAGDVRRLPLSPTQARTIRTLCPVVRAFVCVFTAELIAVGASIPGDLSVI